GAPLFAGDHVTPLVATLTVLKTLPDGSRSVIRNFISTDPLNSTDPGPPNTTKVHVDSGITYTILVTYPYIGLTPPLFAQPYTLTLTPSSDNVPTDFSAAPEVPLPWAASASPPSGASATQGGYIDVLYDSDLFFVRPIAYSGWLNVSVPATNNVTAYRADHSPITQFASASSRQVFINVLAGQSYFVRVGAAGTTV